MPAFSRTLEEEGVVIPPTRAERGDPGAIAERDARAAPAPRRPARPAGGQPDRRAAPRRAGRAPRGRAAARRDGGDPRLLRAPHPGRARGAARRHLPSRGRARRRRPPRASATPCCASQATIEGEQPAARLQRHRRPGGRKSQLPALGDQVGRLLRGPRADRPRRAALAPAPTARSRSSPRPAACSTPSSRPPSPPATSRPPAGSPIWSSPRSPAPARSRPRARGR